MKKRALVPALFAALLPVLAFTLILTGCAGLPGGTGAARTLPDTVPLRPFTLAGYYEDNRINAVPLVKKPRVYVWDALQNAFVPTRANKKNITYQFVAVYDTDGDKTGDELFIVKYADSASYWDANAGYADPRREDPAYAGVYNQEYRIPFGERLLGFADEEGFLGGAVYDYYNRVPYGDLAASIYYPSYDFYHSTSTETLTILTRFKTTQQTAEWTCGMSSALMALEWFGRRDGLNELDLGALRNTREKFGEHRWSSPTDVKMLIRVFESLNEIAGKDVWKWESTYDYVDGAGDVKPGYLSTEWILERLNEGRPILVGWNSFGPHWQTIIGYDTLGTEHTADDVLILADSYDSTDHHNDGYTIQSYERLYHDWTQDFDRDLGRSRGYGMALIFAPYPADFNPHSYAKITGKGLAVKIPGNWNGMVNASEEMLIPYGNTAAVLAASSYEHAREEAGDNGLAGPAGSRNYRQFQIYPSPYYANPDFYNRRGLPDTLILLNKYKTAQQASEWSCGPAAVRTVLEYFGKLRGQTEFDLAQLRENDREEATTLDGIVEIFRGQEGDWAWISTDDLDEEGTIGAHNLCKTGKEGLIPASLKAGIPVIIGWDEWGGHWQVIIGYDDLGTPQTQDDVLILAEPYDTTDHLQDGYLVESFERLRNGWGAAFDPRQERVFLIAAPGEILASSGLIP
ncbi:MAG: hypothetical protein LBT16_02405 [Treponema sp.]|jgi:hypothetical protein|nr:hypothetical protein [Treponema sp.]